MSGEFVLAHLSDVHLGPLPALGPRHWNAKRILGFLNWHRRRRFVHRREAVAMLTEDLGRQRADHIAVTGDLANIGLPREYETGLQWLRSLGNPDSVTVIPGNHDIYAPLRGDPGVGRWQPFMSANVTSEVMPEAPVPTAAQRPDGCEFPFVRQYGAIALVGVNSAVETPLGYATGHVDEAQLARLHGVLVNLGRQGAVRVVLIHHPPLPGQAASHRALSNADEVERVLVAGGAELVLHGHNHRNMLAWCTAATGTAFPVVGVASASHASSTKPEMLARYNLYRIVKTGGEVRIDMTGRGLVSPAGPVAEVEQRRLVPAAVNAHAHA